MVVVFRKGKPLFARNDPRRTRKQGEKFCPCCKTAKARGDFYVNRSRPDGVMSRCKACWKKFRSTAEWREQERLYKASKRREIKESDRG